MAHEKTEVREFLKGQGRGFVPGDHVWVTMWLPVNHDCPCCDGAGTVLGRREEDEHEYNCGVCNGARSMPATVKVIVAEGIVTTVEMSLSHTKHYPEKEERDHVSVGYHVRSVEGSMDGRQGWVNWARSHRHTSESLFDNLKDAEARRDEMEKNGIDRAAAIEKINNVTPKEFIEGITGQELPVEDPEAKQ